MRKKSAMLLLGAALVSSLVAFATCDDMTGDVSESEINSSHEHVFELKNEVAPTCTEYGRKEYACTFDGCEETNIEYIDP